jgi:NAD(P)-dependent dehydrogenase (short-subunit alcohol dehydrogenase family)
MTESFPDQFRALIVGSTGTIGGALMQLLEADPRCAAVVGASRHGQPPLDLTSEASVLAFTESLSIQAPFHLIVIATGVLHTNHFGPEKKLSDLTFSKMQQVFQVNTFGPALLLGPLARKLDSQRGVLAVISAKVGSIGDNRLGGWYSYRASKAALNMMIKTAAIELKRTAPKAVLFALHPGTVTSALSKPFGGDTVGRAPLTAARDMLATINSLQPEDSGSFVSYSGERLIW